MQWLADVSIRRPVFAWVLVLVIAVFGVIGYAKLSVDRLPKIDIPIVQITTRLDGAAPEEMESEVTEKLEEAIGTVAGIDQLDSRSSDGVSLIFVQFVLEKNIDIAGIKQLDSSCGGVGVDSFFINDDPNSSAE